MIGKPRTETSPFYLCVLVCAVCCSLCSCLSAPRYTESVTVPGEVYGQAGPLGTLRLGLVYSKNTRQAFEYMKTHMAYGHRKFVPLLERVDPERVTQGLNTIVENRFKRVTLFDSADDAVQSDVDLILVFDYRCEISQKPGQETVVDMTATFMNRQERIIDAVKGKGATVPQYVSFSYGFGTVLDAAFSELTQGLEKSPALIAFGERRAVPGLAQANAGTQAPAAVSDGSFYNKSWAIVIGINRYDRFPPLEYAVSDARSVAKKLRDIGFDEVIEIVDKDATRERILTMLGSELPKKVRPEDRVLIFFAGHGQTETLADGKEQGYIIPVDADIGNYFTTAISMQQVRDISGRMPAKHILYVMDACYSGTGFTRAFGIEPAVNGYLQKITSLRSVQMITAGGKKEQVVEQQGHGLFTQYFLRGLDGEADRDNDRVVTASELGAYLMPQVSRASDNRQTPQYGRLDGEGEVVFSVSK